MNTSKIASTNVASNSSCNMWLLTVLPGVYLKHHHEQVAHNNTGQCELKSLAFNQMLRSEPTRPQLR